MELYGMELYGIEMHSHLQLRLMPGISRAEESLLCRLWLNVAFTNTHSFRIGMVDNLYVRQPGPREDDYASPL